MILSRKAGSTTISTRLNIKIISLNLGQCCFSQKTLSKGLLFIKKEPSVLESTKDVNVRLGFLGISVEMVKENGKGLLTQRYLLHMRRASPAVPSPPWGNPRLSRMQCPEHQGWHKVRNGVPGVAWEWLLSKAAALLTADWEKSWSKWKRKRAPWCRRNYWMSGFSVILSPLGHEAWHLH